MVAAPLTESAVAAVAALCLFSISISPALSKIVQMRTKRRILARPSCQIQPVVLSGSLVLGGCDRSSKRLLQAASRLGRSRQEVTAEPRLQREKDGCRRRSDAPCQTGRCFRTATFPFCCLLCWKTVAYGGCAVAMFVRLRSRRTSLLLGGLFRKKKICLTWLLNQ